MGLKGELVYVYLYRRKSFDNGNGLVAVEFFTAVRLMFF
jgi:hypothetical protein